MLYKICWTSLIKYTWNVLLFRETVVEETQTDVKPMERVFFDTAYLTVSKTADVKPKYDSF